ncbi:polysaccharide biosynthesis protein [Micromonospora mirobrigensis]|uniref:Membrane protein involved in the export of O-antigen and teichoic acid n=1 Tax=Micromonospora mirobrigensis TaxID=262898 RepID=A0A1C4ZKJ3_9ACTN|nr:polysaccharide biosynthesis protein [Micromonospora mirobrigensis]SCF33590.1 Membrane protein involved in the export of O-antigen and teichoic acid [Micromonospora mirobrigensis]
MGTESDGRTRTSGIGTAGVAVTLAGVFVNGLAYVVPVLGARHLPPAELSALATLLALGAIGGVASTGLQIAVAVHRARHGRAPTGRPTVLTVVVTTVLLALVLPVAAGQLRLGGRSVLLLGVLTVAVVAAGRWLGELQGDQRFLRLAGGMALLAAGRYGGMIAGLALGGGLTGSLLAGAVTSLLVLALLVRLNRGAGIDPVAPALATRTVLTASGATLAMLVVSYADLLLARRFLPPDASGTYAVGTVLTKGALWAPQVVTVIALPRLARGDRRTLLVSLALVGGAGAALVLAAALAGGLAFGLAGGREYTDQGRYAPLFAATGALYALVFVLINARVAASARWPSAPLWVSTVCFVVAVAVAVPHTVGGVAGAALVTAGLTVLVTGASTLRPRRSPSTSDRPAGTTTGPVRDTLGAVDR